MHMSTNNNFLQGNKYITFCYSHSLLDFIFQLFTLKTLLKSKIICKETSPYLIFN